MSTPANDTTRAGEPGSVPPPSETSYLTCPGGRIGYDVAGDGSLVVLVPSMGDLRAGYRFLAPALRAAGYRVACTDLRGHGDSDATFPSYGDEETAGDVTALIDELGGPGIVVGNSMGAGAAVPAHPAKARLHMTPAGGACRHQRAGRTSGTVTACPDVTAAGRDGRRHLRSISSGPDRNAF